MAQVLFRTEERNYLVLRGTAYSDFPPQGDAEYRKVRCPVLILTVEGDASHPDSTARGK